MPTAYIQLGANCSSPSICIARVMGCTMLSTSAHMYCLDFKWPLQKGSLLLVSWLSENLDLPFSAGSEGERATTARNVGLWDSILETALKVAAILPILCLPVSKVVMKSMIHIYPTSLEVPVSVLSRPEESWILGSGYIGSWINFSSGPILPELKDDRMFTE